MAYYKLFIKLMTNNSSNQEATEMEFVYFFSFLIVFAFSTKESHAYSVEDESKLQTDLLAGYNVNVRPSDQVSLRCGLDIMNLLELNIVEQTLAVTGYLIVIWNDQRLSWNESEYGNVSKLYYRSDQIWRPTLVLQNSVTGIEAIGDNGNQKSIPMIVRSNGKVFWLAPAYFTSFCSVEVSKFPFDTQTCELVLSGWLYASDNVQLLNIEEEIDFDKYKENGEYDVIRSYTRVDIYYLSTTSVETLVFGIELRRKYSYYLLNVVLPVFFMQLLSLVVFVVPTESGEKLTFSLTLLLSLTVMMTLVAEKIPTTSLQIPTLSMYMLGGTIISSLELITTVVILHFKHGNEGMYMNNRMQTLATVLASLTCTRNNRVNSKTEVKIMNQKKARVGDETENKNFDKTAPDSTEMNGTNSTHVYMHTNEDISQMLDKVSLFIFSFITFVFTFTMLIMVLY